jgi:competence protein ComEC
MFGQVTLAGLVLNFAAIPLMAVAQVAGIAVVAASLVSVQLSLAIGWLASAAAELLVRSAGMAQLVPHAAWRVATPGWAAIALYYAGIAAAWASAQRRRAAVACALTAAVWIVAEPWRITTVGGDGRLHATFIDVGQGDAIFIRFPRGAALLVDAGGLSQTASFDVGDRVVAPVLRQAGVKRLHALALTHGDADHIGGVPSILREFQPMDVWEGIPVPPFEPLRSIQAMAAKTRSRWTNVQAADTTTIDGVRVIVRHPGLGDWERQAVRNDDSIVLELVWRDVSMVLTGDIGRDVEERIAPLFPPAGLRVVKVPHHGSQTSSTRGFVQALRPRVAVASVGRGNPFGHPAPVVIERYREVGAEIFRTDRDGAVMLETDGHSLSVRGFTGRTVSLRAR